MKKYFEQLEQNFSANGFDNLSTMSNEQKLLALYGYYNFYHADTTCILELLQTSMCLYDASSSDHIDGAFIDTESDDDSIDLVSSYYVFPDMEFLNVNDLESYYQVMYKSAFEALHNIKTVRGKLINFFAQDDDYHFGDGKKKLILTIITNFMPKSDLKKKYINKVHKINIHKDVTCKIVFGQDVEQSVLEIESPKEYVDNGLLIMDKPNNVLKFGIENSIIVNISAKSLKQLYEQFHNQGLFAQNLRYYVKSAKTDSGIIESIKNKSSNFWYYNNGIIIICSNYKITNKAILLEDFSIINGGQTTKLIGDTDFDEDFYIQCKIVRNKYETDKEKSQFISEVAEATNTQKPIKDKDLVANRIEQRELKTKMSSVGVFVQIKRGAVISKKIYPEPWQNTTNEEIGQLLYSFVYQYPGAARNNKASITGNKDRYALIFKKDYNKYFLRDLCHFKAYYKKWLKIAKDNNYYDDPYMEGLLKNGMFFFAATLGVVSKLYFNQKYSEKMRSLDSYSDKYNLLSQYDISHPLFVSNITTLSNDVYLLFKFLYNKYIKDAYIEAKDEDSSTIYSNFMKTDKNYKKFIMKSVIKNYDEKDKKMLENILYKPTENDINENENLLNKYFVENTLTTISYEDLNIDEKELFDKLKTYRTATFKFKKIKAYDVYRDKDIITIVKKKPQSLIELNDLNCLKSQQFNDYGADIISIINGTFNRFKLN